MIAQLFQCQQLERNSTGWRVQNGHEVARSLNTQLQMTICFDCIGNHLKPELASELIVSF